MEQYKSEESRVQEYRKRFISLKTERSSWDQHWRDISDYFLPRRSRFFTTDANRGTKRNDKILHEGPAIAASRLGAGLMAGVTSPARPWFKLTTPEPSMLEGADVRAWLYATEERMREIFHRSNIYNALAQVDEDLGAFGTAAMHVDEDPREVLRAYVYPIGSYCLTTSPRGDVNGLMRESRMKAQQLVKKFGEERAFKASEAIKTAHDRRDYRTMFEVLHVVEPNPSSNGTGMSYRSAWMLSAGTNVFLADGGYYEFPCMAPRWGVTGEDVYGYGPGMHALPSARALQKLQSRMLRIVDKMSDPPMVATGRMQGGKPTLLPGDVTYVPIGEGGAFQPAYVPDARAMQSLREEIIAHEQRINQTMYADLLLMLHYQGPQQRMTAREVEERHEEKILQLGPVMERLEDELLKPLIDRTFGVMYRRRLLPEPIPEALQGMELRVEFVSVLAQAQKLLATRVLDQYAATAMQVAQINPATLDKTDWDQLLDEYGNSLGVPPSIIASDEVVEKIRAQRAEQERMMRMAEMAKGAEQGANAMNTMTDVAEKNPDAVQQIAGLMSRGSA